MDPFFQYSNIPANLRDAEIPNLFAFFHPGESTNGMAWIRQTTEGKLEPTEISSMSWWVVQALLKHLEDRGFLSDEAEEVLVAGGEVLLVGGVEAGDATVGLDSCYIWDLAEGADKTLPITRQLTRPAGLEFTQHVEADFF